jgi:hypothetical protein
MRELWWIDQGKRDAIYTLRCTVEEECEAGVMIIMLMQVREEEA